MTKKHLPAINTIHQIRMNSLFHLHFVMKNEDMMQIFINYVLQHRPSFFALYRNMRYKDIFSWSKNMPTIELILGISQMFRQYYYLHLIPI